MIWIFYYFIFQILTLEPIKNKPDCPPCPSCFNCLLNSNNCKNGGTCNKQTTICNCLSGFGGPDCLTPLCGSLSDLDRPLLEENQCSCKEGWKGINCNMCENDDSCKSLFPTDGGRCYKRNDLIKEKYFMCNVTNKSIIKVLKSNVPKITLTCNKNKSNFNLQFWAGNEESFYCTGSNCEFNSSSDVFAGKCLKSKCQCIEKRPLCGKMGTFSIGSFLSMIDGPIKIDCIKDKCTFQEKSLDNLIQSFFGDPHVQFDCEMSECAHKSQFEKLDPLQINNDKNTSIFTIIITLIISLIGALMLFLLKDQTLKNEYQSLEKNQELLKQASLPIVINFSNLSYKVDKKEILCSLNGHVKSGKMLAIIGSSGAGKTTFLDLLAGRNKTGIIDGEIKISGRAFKKSEIKLISGFVNQEDNFLSYLTVYETILFSALLRLPKDMSFNSKKMLVKSTINELGIGHIENKIIGNAFNRGISGGEKRRVAIACELVTSPSILFLDEPTSGLDSYNALNIISCLKELTSKYNKTVIFSIHQPRSNIIKLFDLIAILDKGKMAFFGSPSQAEVYLKDIRHPCPTETNLSDHFVDLCQNSSINLPSLYNKNRLYNEYKDLNYQSNVTVNGRSNLLKPSYFQQFTILSKRNLTNLYRDPALALSNYSIALVVGLLCGALFYNLDHSLSGFQNRLGLFFFLISLFGFSSLTSLQSFRSERSIFIQERSNNYYSPLSYFLSKVITELLPLKIVPPCLMMIIIYPMTGLNQSIEAFIKCLSILILYNISTTMCIFTFSIIFENPSISSVVASLYILFSMLFSGLFLNLDTLGVGLKWLKYGSIFQPTLEALLINELRYLTLKQEKFGFLIDVPSAIILQNFGFNIENFSFDVIRLTLILFLFLFFAYFTLKFAVKEKK